jgi:hypothetical protein
MHDKLPEFGAKGKKQFFTIHPAKLIDLRQRLKAIEEQDLRIQEFVIKQGIYLNNFLSK